MKITKFNHIIIANVKVMAYTIPNEMDEINIQGLCMELDEVFSCSVILDPKTRSVLVWHKSVERFEGICESLGYKVVQR